jgi:hypothetical protein
VTNTHQEILDRITVEYAQQPCPLGSDPYRYCNREQVRSALGAAALELVHLTPQSRKLDHALDKLDEAVSWCHSAIDRHGVSSPFEGA